MDGLKIARRFREVTSNLNINSRSRSFRPLAPVILLEEPCVRARVATDGAGGVEPRPHGGLKAGEQGQEGGGQLGGRGRVLALADDEGHGEFGRVVLPVRSEDDKTHVSLHLLSGQ